MIKITDLTKGYGKDIILENISCFLENQRIYALVSVNGIGKSTLLNAVTNLSVWTADEWRLMVLTTGNLSRNFTFSMFQTVRRCF